MASEAEDPLGRTGRTRWERAGVTWLSAAWVLFPVAVWIIGILWFGGDLGRTTDDYSTNFRDPATGALPDPFNPWARYPYFWRPLHVAMCFGLGTVFAENWRVLIVFCAVMHALACVVVYRLLRAFTRHPGPAAGGALVVLLHPMNFEVAFWFCSISAAIATGLWCVYALWCCRLVRREGGPRPIELFGLAALALAIPCFYEQPASGVLALPLVLLAAWLAGTTGPGLGRAFGRAIVLCGVAGAMNITYIVLLRLTAPAMARGGSGSFVSADRLPDRVSEVTRSVGWQLFGARMQLTVKGAWQTGIEALATPVGIAAITALGVLAMVWAWAWWTGQDRADDGAANEPQTAPRHAVTSRLCLVGAGAVLFIGAFVPIALMARQNVEPRTLYFPMLGLCIILAQGLDVLLGLLPARGSAGHLGRAARALVALAAASSAVAACICCVGIQAWCHARSHRDESIARRLVELVPDAPPNAVFVPLVLDSGVTSTGIMVFDRLRPPAFGTTWSATALMQQVSRRPDVVAAAINPWTKYPYDRFSRMGFWYALKLDSRATDPAGEGNPIAWDRAVPFVIEDDGRVRLVRQIEIERTDGRTERFAVPAVQSAIRAGTARGAATVITLSDASDPPAQTVTGWSWVDPATLAAGGAVEMMPLESRGMRREGVWLHPSYRGSARAAMQAEIPPHDGPRGLRFRITTPPEDYARFAGAAPVTVNIELLASADAPEPLAAAKLELTLELAEAEPRWVPVDLSVPALPSGAIIRIRVSGARVPGAVHAPVWITPGLWAGPAASP